MMAEQQKKKNIIDSSKKELLKVILLIHLDLCKDKNKQNLYFKNILMQCLNKVLK